MPPSTLGAAAAVLALILWLLRRRRPVVVLRSTDASAVAALNRSQMQATAPEQADAPSAKAVPAAAGPEGPGFPPFSPPRSGPRGQLALLRQLDRSLQGPARDRVEAMRIAGEWRDRRVLPLLRRGLRDPDLAVVAEAARAMEGFRGRSALLQAAEPSLPLPRNLSRTL